MISLKKSIKHLKSSTEPFYDARMIKDEKEIKILKKASKIIDEMFDICAKKNENWTKRIRITNNFDDTCHGTRNV